MKKQSRIKYINALREAVERRYFSRYYIQRQDDILRINAAIDAKTLWALQMGLTAKEILIETKVIEIKEMKREEEKKERRDKEHEIWKRTHIHRWRYKQKGFMQYAKICEDTRCPKHYG